MAAVSPGEAADSSRMSFVSHLAELRKRLMLSVAAVFIAALGAWYFHEALFAWITSPLQRLPVQQLQVLGLVEMFVTYLKLTVLAAIFVAAPLLLLQVWLFVAPGLYAHERRWLLPFVVLGTLFFTAGGAFGFYIVLPLGFEFLVGMVPAGIEANYRVSDYVDLVVQMLLVFGIVFELPLVMWILAAARVVSPAGFARLRKYWIVIAAILGALLTPPDPMTQILMAVPLVLFFELGILGARFVYRRPS